MSILYNFFETSLKQNIRYEKSKNIEFEEAEEDIYGSITHTAVMMMLFHQNHTHFGAPKYEIDTNIRDLIRD